MQVAILGSGLMGGKLGTIFARLGLLRLCTTARRGAENQGGGSGTSRINGQTADRRMAGSTRLRSKRTGFGTVGTSRKERNTGSTTTRLRATTKPRPSR